MAYVHDEEPLGPNGMALVLARRIAELEAGRASIPRSERRSVNRQLHQLRDLLRWCKTRAGYVPTPEDLGLLDGDEQQEEAA